MSRDDSPMLELAAFVVIIALAFAVAAVHAEIVYDDWTCMFAKCVRVKP